VFSGLKLANADYELARLWLQSPINAVLTLLLIIVGIWHMHVGLRVVIEDYIHKSLSKAALLLLNMFVCGLGGALAVFSILKVAFSVSGLAGGAI
jgi:succinate dehydrogenase / fumarate reductase membrane anchor subunit